MKRKCCCGSYPSCDRCFTVAFTANFCEAADTVATYVRCDLGGGCTGTQLVLTKTWHANLRRIRAHGYSLTDSPNYPTPCCFEPCETVAWEPPATTFPCEFTWCTTGTGCGASGPLLAGSSNVRQKSSTNGAGSVVACCVGGGPDCTGYEIQFTGQMPSVVLSSPSCDQQIVVGPGAPVTWPATTITLRYCPRPGTNQCLLDLTEVSIGAADGLGGGGNSSGDCECTPGTGGVTVDVKGTPPTVTETAAGGFGPLWSLAGAPPLTVLCKCCP